MTRFYESDAVQAVMPMGSGKTAAALTAIAELKEDGHIRCALTLAPKRVAKLVWQKEPHLWEHLHHLRVKLVAGTAKQRLEALLDADGEEADVYVVGVDNVQWLVGELQKLPVDHKLFDLLNIDESSRFRNPRGKRGRALQKITSRFRIKWELTGTPRPRGYEDQFRPMQLLTDEKLWRRSFGSWRLDYFIKVDANGEPSEYGHDYAVRAEHEAKIVADISRLSFTISKEDLPETPGIEPVFHWVDLPRDAMKAYKDMERKLLYRRDAKENILAASQAIASGKLAQMANGFIYDEEREVEYVHSEKADTLVDLVEGAASDNLIACYGFKPDLALLLELYPGMPYIGAGVGENKSEEIERLWNQRKIPLLGLHPASGGHGLNLQHGGSQMIFYDMPWSSELYDQTVKRIDRPGQTEVCYIHHILARGTVDEMKYDRVIKRMTAEQAFRNYLEKI